MAYDRQFLRIDFLFAIGGTAEVAVTSINYASIAGWTGAAAALEELRADGTVAGDSMAAMLTFIRNANLFWADYSDLTGIKFAAVGTDGHYIAEPFPTELTPAESGAAANTLPQSTVVLSLRSGLSLGSANYGRMYLPHTRIGMVAGTPATNVATTDIIAAAGKTFVNDLTAALQDPVTAIITPMIMTAKTGAASKAVTAVAVGTVTDTQRRRRNKLIETYSTDTLA